ncbi:MAG: hypothetical protein EOM85_03445 [Candidatus Moranbacteria bacterium]|nr:hypothetical protein [Candidatus Moranbacteria bacterium]
MKAIYLIENGNEVLGEYGKSNDQNFQEFLAEAERARACLERESRHNEEMKNGDKLMMYIVGENFAENDLEEESGNCEVYYDEDDDWGTHTYSRRFNSWGEAKDWVDKAKKYSNMYNFDIVER